MAVSPLLLGFPSTTFTPANSTWHNLWPPPPPLRSLMATPLPRVCFPTLGSTVFGGIVKTSLALLRHPLSPAASALSCPTVTKVLLSLSQGMPCCGPMGSLPLDKAVLPRPQLLCTPIFHTSICIVSPSHSSLKLCTFEWLQCSGSWWVAAFIRASLPKAPRTPSLSSPELGLTLPPPIGAATGQQSQPPRPCANPPPPATPTRVTQSRTYTSVPIPNLHSVHRPCGGCLSVYVLPLWSTPSERVTYPSLLRGGALFASPYVSPFARSPFRYTADHELRRSSGSSGHRLSARSGGSSDGGSKVCMRCAELVLVPTSS